MKFSWDITTVVAGVSHGSREDVDDEDEDVLAGDHRRVPALP